MHRDNAGFAALCFALLLALGCSEDGPTTPQLPDSIGMEAGSDIAWQVVSLATRFTTASFDDRPWDPVEAIVTPLRLPMLEGLGLAFETAPSTATALTPTAMACPTTSS